jgi:hypothetical protein
MRNKFIIILTGLFIITGVSCKKYLDTAYKNPNLPVTAPPEDVLLGVIGSIQRGISFDARNIGPYVQYWARTSSFDSWERHGYLFGAGSGNNGADIWRMHYFTFGQNLVDMISNGQTQNKLDYTGAAYAMFAYSWLNLADVYNHVILTEAFRRDQLVFNFDDQDKVYPHVIKMADSAIFWFNQASATGSTLAIGDQYLYQGNVSKWKKFAYAMKAKAYHRYYNKSNYKPDSVIKYCDLAFGSPADDAIVKFNAAAPDASGINFFGPTRNNFGTFRAGAYLVNLMNGNIITGVTDPRVKYMFKPCGDGLFRGITQNAGEPAATPATQKIPNFWGFANVYAAPTGGVDTGARTYYKNASPLPICTYAEMQFTKAEAALKKNDYTTALAAYKNGIAGNMDMLTTYYTGYVPITATDKNNFINNPLVSPPAATDLTQRMIMQQKYVALYGWGFVETWVDMRKHNYDVTNIYPGWKVPTGSNDLFPDNAGKLAYRIRPRYDSEYLWNREKLETIGGLQPDYHTKKTWFSEP